MASRTIVFQIFKAKNRQYGWRLRGRNGMIIATAHETFTRRRDATRACYRLYATMTGAEDFTIEQQ